MSELIFAKKKNRFKRYDIEATCSFHTVPSSGSHNPYAAISQTPQLQSLSHNLCEYRVTRIVSDSGMTFTLEAAQELGIPVVIFATASACGLMGYLQLCPLIEKGLIPHKGTLTSNS